jgi:hypothetical protein
VSDASKDLVVELLAQSLAAWRVAGSVERTSSALLVRAGTTEISIERAAEKVPFRWMVSVRGRKRGAISLVAVLRQVRAALDPDHAANRARVVLSPPVPS